MHHERRVKRERKTNKMQLIWCLLSNFYLNMRPSSTQPQPAQPVQNTTCSSTRSCSMMGIMISETCRDRSWIINITLVASCWFFSLFTLQYFSLVFLYWGKVIIIIVAAVVTAKCLCELRQHIIKQWRYRHSGMLHNSTGKYIPKSRKSKCLLHFQGQEPGLRETADECASNVGSYLKFPKSSHPWTWKQ